MKDCKDESDEQDCKRMIIPGYYDRAKPAELPQKLEMANPLNIQVKIKNIDFVNTISMSVGLTIELSVTWRDYQLTYFNLLHSEGAFNDTKGVNSHYYEKIWLPIPMIEHENAVIGNIKEDKNMYIQIQPVTKPKPLDPVLHTEDMLYPV